jgi:hypothetical protein
MYSFPMSAYFVNGRAVAALPGESDVTNAVTDGGALLALLNRGTPGVMADMTARGSVTLPVCALSSVPIAGLGEWMPGSWWSSRIPAARTVFTIIGADTLIRLYPSLDKTVAAPTGTAAGNRAARRTLKYNRAPGQRGRLRFDRLLSSPVRSGEW